MRRGQLSVARLHDVPLREVSGLCLRRAANAETTLVAIGDRAATVAQAVLPNDHEAELRWRLTNLSRVSGSALTTDDPQLEAICADGAGRFALLQESPARMVLIAVDGASLGSIDLHVPREHPLGLSWRDPDGSRGEGALLLANGHLLVAKEKDPPAFLEFGPAGSAPSGASSTTVLKDGASWPGPGGDVTFEPLAAWMLDDRLADACHDLSDLEIGPDGHIYVLSDASASLARLADLSPDGGAASAEAVWHLKGIDGKAEGLAFTPEGHAIVALDTSRAKGNLALMDPPIASPDARSAAGTPHRGKKRLS